VCIPRHVVVFHIKFTSYDNVARFRHKNVITLYGCSTDGPSVCLIYEYMVNGSLQHQLSRQVCSMLESFLQRSAWNIHKSQSISILLRTIVVVIVVITVFIAIFTVLSKFIQLFGYPAAGV